MELVSRSLFHYTHERRLWN